MNDTIKIGPQAFAIIVVKDLRAQDKDDRLQGEISYSHSEVRLDENLDAFGRRQVLWHEILHGILTQAGMQTSVKNEENIIDALSYGILSALQDNPWLAGEAELK